VHAGSHRRRVGAGWRRPSARSMVHVSWPATRPVMEVADLARHQQRGRNRKYLHKCSTCNCSASHKRGRTKRNPRAHTMPVLTPCQCSHHASAHTMSVLTPCQCSHHVSAHTMPVLTPCQCSHHVSEVDGSSRASRRDVCPSLGSQKCTSLQVHIAEQHNPPQLWLAD